jgi:hypothetical protein
MTETKLQVAPAQQFASAVQIRPPHVVVTQVGSTVVIPARQLEFRIARAARLMRIRDAIVFCW